ncbi:MULTISPECIES: BTAD domain-containing putative transcriptional regulator [unclassified Streptomyces]|uniref:ATP-binding protein n=1 Tax=unclassified Streptomyces TaxID=2593676 RepID=UPI00278BF924|nr:MULTISPECIES: BTAD domain-containing putative transcriptional regulator [unclassified Streptomyces]
MTPALTLLPRVTHRGQEITAPRLRGLLALLASTPRTGCSVERLVTGLWPNEPPQHPTKAVQVLVARARAQLGADLIASTPTGYRLTLPDDQVDSSALLRHATACATHTRSGDHAAALAEAEAGLALWDGGEDTDAEEAVGDDPVAALRAERRPVHLDLTRARALALARLGRHAEAKDPLAETSARLPRDEEVHAELLRAEAATTGPSAALTRYETYRRTLREELGTNPGPHLRAVHAELLHDDPPTVRHGVPHEPNQLLGRATDIASVEELLRASRAVTVVGPGGLGKTRLAYAVARRAEQRLVHVVPLAAVGAEADIAAEVAAALGVGEGRRAGVGGHAPADPVSGIAGTLGAGPALLVLDNCEHVVAGVATLVHELLARARDLRVLATSRSPLGLTSEAVYALPELGQATSAELFAQRARAARPGVDLPPDAVAELCRHLDGLPLAVELAAARVRALSVPDIARRLGDRFALLRGGARDAPERHRTLHAVVEWSWNLLSEEARAALRTLSVFPGGFSGAAAERVLGDDALTALEQLAEQSLLTVADTPAGVRFRMLETVREFSAARRAESGDEDHAVSQLRLWAREFGVTHHDTLLGPRSPETWELIRAEQDNLVAALRHALARGDGPTTAAVTAVLAALWSTDSDFARLSALAADTGAPLSHYRPAPAYVEVARAAAVLCAASLIVDHAPRVVRHLVTLRRLPPAPPDTLLRAIAVVLSAVPEMLPPGYDVLRELCASEHRLVVSVAESVATYVWEHEHDIDRALASARRVVESLGPLDIPPLEVMGYSRLSELCLKTGDGEAAYRYLGAAREALPRMGDEDDYVGVRWGFALACLQRGDPDEAESWQRRAEAEGTAQKDPFYSPDLGVRAEIALARGDTEAGLALWRRAVDRLPVAGAGRGDGLWLDPWALQLQATAVTAHAYAGHVAPVAETVDRLRSVLSGPAADGLDLPVVGTVLHALGAAGLTGRAPVAVRQLALAERLWVLRDFQPTTAAGRARRAAEHADRAAYTDAVAEYAALARDELRDAARAVVAPDSATAYRG